MTAAWSQPGVPHKGWSWDGVDDLGSLDGHCEMCGTEIRYVHHMSHPEWDGGLGVGCVCAEKMTDDYVGPREHEKRLRQTTGQRTRWLQRKWKSSKTGNAYLNVDRKTLRNAGRDNPASVNVVVFATHNGTRWGAKIGGTWVPGNYGTEQEAKIAAYRALKTPRQQS